MSTTEARPRKADPTIDPFLEVAHFLHFRIIGEPGHPFSLPRTKDRTLPCTVLSLRTVLSLHCRQGTLYSTATANFLCTGTVELLALQP